MAEESEGRKFLDRLREATVNVTQMTKEGVESLQTKRELSQAYGDLGRKTAELVESGAISHPDLSALCERIGELQAQLASSDEAEDAEAAPDDADTAPPAS
jgi:multidrug resistance efflux pump